MIADLAPLKAFLVRHGISADDFHAVAVGDGAHHRYERGELSNSEYAEAFLAEFGLNLDPETFLVEFVDWPGDLYDGARELMAAVRATGMIVAALSNSNPLHWESGFAVQSVRPLFDFAFASHELGVAKPDRQIYLRVAEELAIEPAAIIYFDDNQANVDGATAVGFHALRVIGPMQAATELVTLGVLGTMPTVDV